MDRLFLGFALGLCILLGVLAGVLVYRPVGDWLAERRREREMRRIFEQTNRQQQLERLARRRELYLGFRNAAAAMVEELADGAGRWSSFYLTRDLLREITAKAEPGVAMAARQMCFVAQVMLNEGFSDELSVRFNQAMHRYDTACREDLAVAEQQSWPSTAGSDGGDGSAVVEGAMSETGLVEPEEVADGRVERRYFRVL
ncbi:MAG TPA: hypothetical protein ENK16_08310 [Chromatiales bacterium]|nr:hypothetical protein [Chromatiales bacterium]